MKICTSSWLKFPPVGKNFRQELRAGMKLAILGYLLNPPKDPIIQVHINLGISHNALRIRLETVAKKTITVYNFPPIANFMYSPKKPGNKTVTFVSSSSSFLFFERTNGPEGNHYDEIRGLRLWADKGDLS